MMQFYEIFYALALMNLAILTFDILMAKFSDDKWTSDDPGTVFSQKNTLKPTQDIRLDKSGYQVNIFSSF